MKLWLTTGLITTPTETRLAARWRRIVPAATFVEAQPHEIHGELLNRIWSEARDDDDPIQVISELDFIPYDNFQMEMLTLLSQAPAFFVEYVTRAADLTLQRRGPLSGAWLLGINRDLGSPDLPLNWLEASGPFNDAANSAYGLYPEDPDVIFEEGRDEAPNSLGLEYEGLGYHCFFSRHFADPPSTELFKGYTLGRHLADINSRLDALEA